MKPTDWVFPKYKNQLYRQDTVVDLETSPSWVSRLFVWNVIYYSSIHPSLCQSVHPSTHLFTSLSFYNCQLPLCVLVPLLYLRILWMMITGHLTSFSYIKTSSLSHFFCPYLFSLSMGRPRQDIDHSKLSEKRDVSCLCRLLSLGRLLVVLSSLRVQDGPWATQHTQPSITKNKGPSQVR